VALERRWSGDERSAHATRAARNRAELHGADDAHAVNGCDRMFMARERHWSGDGER